MQMMSGSMRSADGTSCRCAEPALHLVAMNKMPWPATLDEAVDERRRRDVATFASTGSRIIAAVSRA